MASSHGSSHSSEQKLSDHSGYYSPDGDFTCSIEAYIASKDKFRVVGHNIARAYPMKTGLCSNEMEALVEGSVDAAAAKILQHYRIDATCGLYKRWRPLEEVKHTYLIRTSDTDSSAWRPAAVEINRLFLAAGVEQHEIEVEIVNYLLSNHRTSSVLPNDPNMLNLLEGTRSRVINFLEAYAPSFWTSIAFHMRHNKFRPQETKKPTILVFFYIGACAKFDSLERELRGLLRPELMSGLRLEFLSGEIDVGALPGPQPLIPKAPIGLLPQNGDSLGVHGENTEAGTLGGWLTLKWPGEARCRKVAMTVFYLVSSRKTSDDPILHAQPVDATGSNNRIQMEFPAAFDRKYAIDQYRTRIQDEPDQANVVRYQKELDRLMKHDANPVIGSVIYYSGVRKNANNHRMDWALFETKKTWAPNIPPPVSVFDTEQSRWPDGGKGAIDYKADANSRIRGFGKLKEGDWVVKRGRTTRYTSGTVNKLNRSIKWQAYNRFITEECEVHGLIGDFADGGDSGSWVTNEKHELVGMVIGKDSDVDKFNIDLVSDIGEIERDPKELCSGTSTLP